MSSFTIASLIINLLLICILIPKLGKRLHEATYRLYLIFPVILIIVALSYEFTTSPLPGFVPRSIAYLTFVRLLGNYFKLFLAYLLVVFAGFMFGIVDIKKHRHLHQLLIAPVVIATIEAVLTPSFHLLFYYDSNFNYHDGSMEIIYYFLAIYCYIIGASILIYARKNIGRQNFIVICILVLISSLGMIIHSRLGAVNFDVFIHSIVCMAMLYILADSDELVNTLKTKNEEISQLMKQTVYALTSTIEVKDEYTKGHSDRVARYSVEIASKLGMDDQELEAMYYAALMHDIGKIGIPVELINKPGKLTEEEYAQIKQHTINGAKITKSITSLPQMEQVARWHHERFDGKGYPDGLAGEDIPLSARIVSIADSFDAMTSDRIYRKAKTISEARSELITERSKQFDPELVDIMVSIIDCELFDHH